MKVDSANVTYESQSGNVMGRVTRMPTGSAKIELRYKRVAHSVWKLDSTHRSVTDACEVLEEILKNS